MKNAIKITAVGLTALVTIGVTGAFIMLPTVFEAKYEGESFVTKDGKKLATFVRLPEGEGPFPTLMVRSPYELPHTPLSGMPAEDFSNVPDSELGKVGWEPLTEAGYALVIQHTRGRVGSEGMTLDAKDRDDALELIEWIKEQAWSNGKIGTTGDSIEAILAVLTNSENPDGVVASFVQMGPPNMVNDVMHGPGGALKLELFLPWTAEQILTSDAHHFREMGYGPIKRRTSIIDMGLRAADLISHLENPEDSKAWNHLPLMDYPGFSEASESWNALLEARPGSEVSEHFNGTASNVPTYNVAAWFDVFASSQINAYLGAEERGVDQRLLILNGTHFTPENPGAWPIQPLIPWFDYHLKGETSALLELPRVIFPVANMQDEWYGSPTWPPAASTDTAFALSASGSLAVNSVTPVDGGVRSYQYDPENPVPTVGGRNLLITHGPLDQSAVREDSRADVLSYHGDVLRDDVIVMGAVNGFLAIKSDVPDTDFTVKILDVSPDGTATLVTEGIQRARFREGLGREVFLKPGELYQLKVDLGHIAWRFQKGHRIAVDISSSNFPQWARNLNTGAPLYATTEMQVANNEIYHGGANGSYVELPVIADLSGLERFDEFVTSVEE